jgi:hypothetical protein
LSLLRTRAEAAGKKLATFTLETNVRLATTADLNAFVRDLTKAVARLAAKYHDERTPRGRLFKFIVGSYPVINKSKNSSKEERHASTKK